MAVIRPPYVTTDVGSDRAPVAGLSTRTFRSWTGRSHRCARRFVRPASSSDSSDTTSRLSASASCAMSSGTTTYQLLSAPFHRPAESVRMNVGKRSMPQSAHTVPGLPLPSGTSRTRSARSEPPGQVGSVRPGAASRAGR